MVFERRCTIEITVLTSCQPKLNRKWSYRCAQNQNEANGSRKKYNLSAERRSGWRMKRTMFGKHSENVAAALWINMFSVVSALRLGGKKQTHQPFPCFTFISVASLIFVSFFFWSHIFEVGRSPRYLRVGASSWCSGGGRVRVRRALSNFWASLVKAKHLSLPRSTSVPLSPAAQGLLMGLVPAV